MLVSFCMLTVTVLNKLKYLALTILCRQSHWKCKHAEFQGHQISRTVYFKAKVQVMNAKLSDVLIQKNKTRTEHIIIIF